MIKKTKSIINKLCITFVIAILCVTSVAVIAGSAVKNDDMKYSVGIVDAEGEILDRVPIGIGIRGDANSDDEVNVRDAAQVANFLAKSSANKNYMPEYRESLGGAMADANNDRKLNVRDVAAIAKYLASKSVDPDVDWE